MPRRSTKTTRAAEPSRGSTKNEATAMSKKSSAALIEPEPASVVAPPVDEEAETDEELTAGAAPATEGEGGEGELVVLDEEFEFEEPEPEAESDDARPPAKTKAEEGGGDSMLARYFREMATHPVMGQEE